MVLHESRFEPHHHPANANPLNQALQNRLAMDPLLNPFTLQFPSPANETAYTRNFADNRAQTYDRKAWIICLVVHSLFVLLHGGYKDALLITYGVTLVCQGVAVHALHGPCASPLRRLLLTIAFRLVTDAVIANGLLPWNGTCTLHAWPKHLLISTGVFSLWWQAFMYVQPFKWILLTQALAVLQYHRAMAAPCCASLVASPAGEALVRLTWHHVSHVASSISLVGRVDVLEATAMEAITDSPHLACLVTTLLLQAILGYTVPVAVLYWLERKERIAFWAAVNGQPAAEVAAAMRMGRFACVAVAVLVLLVMVCMWESAVVLLYNHLLPCV